MSDDTSGMILGAAILVVLIPALYFLARFVTKIGDAWGAHLLAPLAPAIGGTVHRSGPHIDGTYENHALRVSFAGRTSVGSGESATSINAFYIEVLQLPGRENWRIKFYGPGLLRQGPNAPFIEAETALGDRLKRAGVLEAVSKVSTPTEGYVTVAYDARRQVLTYTDDVSPRWLPSPEAFAMQLVLAARLAAINAQVNPVASARG